MTRLGALLAALIIVLPAAVRCDESGALLEENRFLEHELTLAKQDKVYFVFDLQKGQASLKIRGNALRTFPLRVRSSWGDSVDSRPVALLEKSALDAPTRPEIKPGDTDIKATTDLEALELSDMPSNYTLVMERGIRLHIRGAGGGFRRSLASFWYGLKWYLGQPLVTLWHSYRGRPYSAFTLVLDETDARSIYWSFPEGARAVIRRPAASR